MLDKAVEIKSFSEKQNASYDKARRLSIANSVHFNNSTPKDILVERQPMESKVDQALDYRLRNYRNETFSLFKRALDIIIEALSKSKSSVESSDKRVQEFLKNYLFFQNNKVYNTRDFIFDALVQVKAYDPNAIILTIPKNVGESFRLGVDFKERSITNNSNDVEIRLFTSRDILKADFNEVVVRLGKWSYIDTKGDLNKGSDCYLRLYINENNKSQINLIYQENFKWYELPYSEIDSQILPFVILGSNVNSDCVKVDNNEVLINYFASDFFGALQIADTFIGEKSDLQVQLARSHSIKYMIDQDCDAGCMHNPTFGYNVINNGSDFVKCQKCEGSGKLMTDTSPFTTVTIKPKGGLDLQGDLKSPIGWATPPSEMVNVHREICKETYERVANELCIDLNQKLVAETAGAKKIDIATKITMYGNFCDDMIRIYKQLVVCVNAYMSLSAEVTINKPQTWDVKSKEDILTQLTDAKANKAPLFTIQSLSKELLSKYLSVELEHPAITFIMSKDKLLVYSLDDLNTAKGIYGEDMTLKDIIVHDNIIPIVSEIIKEPTLDLETEFNKIIEPLLAEIKPKVIG